MVQRPRRQYLVRSRGEVIHQRAAVVEIPSAAVGRNQIGGSLRPPCRQSFNTEVTAMLRVLRVEGLIVTDYTEPLPGNDMLIRT